MLTGSILFNLSDGVIEGVIEGVEDKIVEADRDVLRQWTLLIWYFCQGVKGVADGVIIGTEVILAFFLTDDCRLITI